MRVIEVWTTRSTFSDLVSHMREWLSRNDCPVAEFETERDGISVLVKVQFDDNSMAERFRQAFRGSYAG